MWLPALGSFLGFANDNVITLGPGDCTTNQEDVVGFAHLNNFEILAGALNLTHVTGHAHAAHDRAGEQALADCARAAMPAFGPVSRVATGERMAANDAFKAAAFGDANGVH